jgi:hypothetical protein
LSQICVFLPARITFLVYFNTLSLNILFNSNLHTFSQEQTHWLSTFLATHILFKPSLNSLSLVWYQQMHALHSFSLLTNHDFKLWNFVSMTWTFKCFNLKIVKNSNYQEKKHKLCKYIWHNTSQCGPRKIYFPKV